MEIDITLQEAKNLIPRHPIVNLRYQKKYKGDSFKISMKGELLRISRSSKGKSDWLLVSSLDDPTKVAKVNSDNVIYIEFLGFSE